MTLPCRTSTEVDFRKLQESRQEENMFIARVESKSYGYTRENFQELDAQNFPDAKKEAIQMILDNPYITRVTIWECTGFEVMDVNLIRTNNQGG